MSCVFEDSFRTRMTGMKDSIFDNRYSIIGNKELGLEDGGDLVFQGVNDALGMASVHGQGFDLFQREVTKGSGFITEAKLASDNPGFKAQYLFPRFVPN